MEVLILCSSIHNVDMGHAGFQSLVCTAYFATPATIPAMKAFQDESASETCDREVTSERKILCHWTPMWRRQAVRASRHRKANSKLPHRWPFGWETRKEKHQRSKIHRRSFSRRYRP